MKKIILSVTGFLFFALSVPAFAEDVTITTSYPSPYGVYKNLEIVNNGTNGSFPGSSSSNLAKEMTQNGIRVLTSMTNQTYMPGIWWETNQYAGDVDTPRAGIWAYSQIKPGGFPTWNGTGLLLGTSAMEGSLTRGVFINPGGSVCSGFMNMWDSSTGNPVPDWNPVPALNYPFISNGGIRLQTAGGTPAGLVFDATNLAYKTYTTHYQRPFLGLVGTGSFVLGMGHNSGSAPGEGSVDSGIYVDTATGSVRIRNSILYNNTYENPRAILDLSSGLDLGFDKWGLRLPDISTGGVSPTRNSMTLPGAGLVAFNRSTGKLNYTNSAAAWRAVMPTEPDYDSGWQSNWGGTLTATPTPSHNLGAASLDAIVDLQFKDSGNVLQSNPNGYWRTFNATNITVVRPAIDENLWQTYRVRIWKTRNDQ